MHILRDIKGIGIIEMNKKDIVRHKLVTKIVEAYEKEKSTNSPLTDNSAAQRELSQNYLSHAEQARNLDA